MKTVLIVEDDRSQRHFLRMLLQKKGGYNVIEAGHGQEALDLLKEDRMEDIVAVILDLGMPQMDGMEALSRIKKMCPNLPVIMLTAMQELDKAVEAMRYGATDFLNKPVQVERLLVSLRNALRMNVLTKEVSRLSRQHDGGTLFSDLIGFDQGLRESVHIGRKAADSSIPVLVTGETGVGKELFARAIHGESDRSGKAFVAVNCGAIPSQLVESTLFGHEKGSFTGAVEKTSGKFREAEGGTIFLDEVGELPLDTQVKLLRVLQQNEVEPVGAGQAVPVNVRVISATNRDLEEEVREGRFREDLYFRLNVFPIPLPSLSGRMEDIPALVRHFIHKYAAQESKFFESLKEEDLQALKAKRWSGNIRELENAIHRAVVLSDPDNFVSSLLEGKQSLVTSGSSSGIDLFAEEGRLKTLDEIEQEAMSFAVNYFDDNITKAAKSLGVAKSTFYRKYKN